MDQTARRSGSSGYQVLMLVLCVYALSVLAVHTAVHLQPQTQAVLNYADYAVCMVFFTDFCVSLIRAPNRTRYFFTWGWLDLLSSIPMVDITRWGRIARVVRILRILRGLRATKLIAMVVIRGRAQSTFLAAALVALLLIVFCSIAVLNFETAPDSNIKTAQDAVWWAFSTMTTVGYGDRYPVTAEGRFVAVILMCSGVGLFGIFSGFLAAWFIGSPDDQGKHASSEDLRGLAAEVSRLREVIEKDRASAPSERSPIDPS